MPIVLQQLFLFLGILQKWRRPCPSPRGGAGRRGAGLGRGLRDAAPGAARRSTWSPRRVGVPPARAARGTPGRVVPAQRWPCHGGRAGPAATSRVRGEGALGGRGKQHGLCEGKQALLLPLLGDVARYPQSHPFTELSPKGHGFGLSSSLLLNLFFFSPQSIQDF